MYASSSTSHDYHRSPFGPPVSEKLTRDNYLLWKAQVLPPIRGAQLDGHLDGSGVEPPKRLQVVKDDKTKEEVPNPAYSTWLAHDQQVLGHLLNSLTKDVLGQVAMASTAAEAGRSSKTCSRRNLAHELQICGCNLLPSRREA
jgi:hypothetical protein